MPLESNFQNSIITLAFREVIILFKKIKGDIDSKLSNFLSL